LAQNAALALCRLYGHRQIDALCGDDEFVNVGFLKFN
jgi:hypothetical protein